MPTCTAFKATLVATTTHQCRRAYNFTVVEQFELKDTEDCSTAPDLEVGSHFLALGHDKLDDQNRLDSELMFSNGETYIVTGVDRAAPECSSGPLWEVSDGIISPWVTKHDKKMKKWVVKGNEAKGCPS